MLYNRRFFLVNLQMCKKAVPLPSHVILFFKIVNIKISFRWIAVQPSLWGKTSFLIGCPYGNPTQYAHKEKTVHTNQYVSVKIFLHTLHRFSPHMYYLFCCIYLFSPGNCNPGISLQNKALLSAPSSSKYRTNSFSHKSFSVFILSYVFFKIVLIRS